MSRRPVLRIVKSEISIPSSQSSKQDACTKQSSFPNDGSLELLDRYEAREIASLNALYKQLRSLWGKAEFEGARMSFYNMRTRCKNGYAELDASLDTFVKFLRVLGPRPNEGDTVDRIDNNAGYTATNVRWASKELQARNRSSTHLFKLQDGQYTLREASQLSGETTHAIRQRRLRGLDDESAVYGLRLRTRDVLSSFSEQEVRLWSHGQLEQAVWKAKRLRPEDKRVVMHELSSRLNFAESNFEKCYVPDHICTTPEQDAEMAKWGCHVSKLRNLLVALAPTPQRPTLVPPHRPDLW